MSKSNEGRKREAEADSAGATSDRAIGRADDGAGASDDADGEPADRERSAVLLAPALLAVAYGIVALLAGGSVFDVGAPGLSGGLATGLLAIFLLVSLRGTLGVYDDAQRVRESSADWRPEPWAYVVGGAAGLVGVRAVQLWTGAVETTAVVPYLAGNAVVAGVLASLVAGPIYLYQRSRRLDEE